MVERCITYQGKPAVWPLPNHCSWGQGSLAIPSAITINCDDCFRGEALIFIADLQSYGIAANLSNDADAVVRVEKVSADLGEEGYLLDVSPAGISVKACDSRGLFYGFQTLIQLIVNSHERIIPAVAIADSPFKQVRGAQIFVPSKKNLKWFRNFIDFLAKYKFNTVFLETGAAMRFDTHPEINEAWEQFCREMRVYPGGPDTNKWGDNGMQMLVGHIKDCTHIENGGSSFIEKAEMAELADYCRSRHIEIVPEVQGLSHAYWLLLAHKDCAERSDDPYPDTWCTSNPNTYEIYFDCLQEIVDVIKPKMVSLGHDEFYSVGLCERCRDRTGHDIFADDVLKCHQWLKERGIRTHIWSDKLLNVIKKDEMESGMGCGGASHLNFNQRTRRNEPVKATFRAADRMPRDLMLSDWYYSFGVGTQDYFNSKGLTVLFGNFDPKRFEDMGDRLRRPNVIGAEVSLWQETSDLGMALADALVLYLEAVNILWNRDYQYRDRGQHNRLIAQIYPFERDRMNGVSRPSGSPGVFRPIDLSGLYNAPLCRHKDYRFIASTEKIPHTVPFEICKDTQDVDRDPACMLVGRGEAETASIPVGGEFRSIAFLHSYTEHLGGPPTHSCGYVGQEEDIVGHYIVEYADGTTEAVPIEYARTIYTSGASCTSGAHWADPVYQEWTLREEIEQMKTSRKLVLKDLNRTVFSYEWINPHPEKPVKAVTVSHNAAKEGAIALFGITGIE